MPNPVALIASTLDAVAALSMSAVRSLLYFFAKPTTASLVISREKNPVIPFIVFQGLTLFPFTIVANIDLNELDSLTSIVPLIEKIKITDFGLAIVYFLISYPLVNIVSYALKRKRYVFRLLTRAVQNLYAFTIFVIVGCTTIALPFARQFLIYQKESSSFQHQNRLYSAISYGTLCLTVMFIGFICYRLIYRSKTRFLKWTVAAGGSVLFVALFFISLISATYLYSPMRHPRYLVESFKCIADDKDLSVRVVLKSESGKSVFIEQFFVFVKESDAPSDNAKVYWANSFKVGKEEKPARDVIIFPDERILLSFDVQFSTPGELTGKSCALPLNPLRTQGSTSGWQDILVRKPERDSFQDQDKN
jgi:hypothetical protein